MAENKDVYSCLELELKAWKIVAQRASGESVEELQKKVDSIFKDEPESLND